MADTDEHLAARALKGHSQAFATLVVRYEKKLFRLAANLLRRPDLAADAVQDSFLSAYGALNSFDPGRASFSTWLYRITKNRCLNMLKQHREITGADFSLVASPSNPEHSASTREAIEALDRALDCLPEKQRTAFLLAEVQGLSLREVAQVEGVRQGTVKSRLSRARKQLRKALAPFER